MLCRLCIFECTVEDCFEIFSDENETNLIVKYLQLEVAENDDLPSKICSNCMQHLKDFDDFFCFIKRRQDLMKTVYLENEQTNEVGIDSPTDVKFVIPETLIDDNDALNEYEEINMSDMEPEILDFVETFDSGSSAVVNVTQQVEIQKSTSLKRLENQVQRNQSFSNTFEQQNLSGGENKSINKKSNSFVKSISEITDEKDKFIEEHVQLKCKICREVLHTFKHFQIHFREKHNCPAYIKCCGSRFYSRQQIVQHIQTHVNPDLFKCKVCNIVLSSQKNLTAHFGSFHTDKEKLPFVCEICGDRFTTSFILRTHMIVHEEGHNYACEICNKTFKHFRSVKRHKSIQHDNKFLYVCELCGKSYKHKQQFEAHMADKHNIISNETMKCAECRCWFSTKYDKKHAERHQLKDVECKHCGKICPSKVALDKHLDSHYHKTKCQTCGRSFNHPKDLREHMKTHAS